MSIAPLLALALALQDPPVRGVPKQIPADTQPVTTTASGLKHCILRAGEPGSSPKPGDRVSVHYTGWNTDGSVFDSSRANAKPAAFLLGVNLIDGWNEALAQMTPGAWWKITVPPQLAYGAQGSPPNVGPNATLIFELELLSFEKGIDLPEFRAGDPARQKRTESGLVYEPITESGGERPAEDDLLELEFALWNEAGRLLDCTEQRGGPVRGGVSDFQIRVLQIVPQYLTVGSRWRFEVPPELAPNLGYGKSPHLPVGAKTIWEVGLKSIVKLPFTPPDPAKQVTTASGLKYEVLAEGDGEKPPLATIVTVHYTGWLTDGTRFDTSHRRAQPTKFPLAPGRIIPGWIEGLQLMRTGAKYRFEIPGPLGFGPAGSPPVIPPDATVIFEIELIAFGE